MKTKLTNTLVKSLESHEAVYSVRDTEIKGFLLKVYPSGKKVYYLDYRTKDGQRKSFQIGSHGNITPAQAREVAALRAADVAHGKDIQKEKQEAKKKASQQKMNTLKGFIYHSYREYVENNHKAPAITLGKIESQFGFLMNRPLSEITPWTIEKWRSEQKKAGKKDSSINRELMALKACLSRAVEWGILATNPIANVKPVKLDDQGRVRYLSGDEEKRLLDALDNRELRIRTDRASGNLWRAERGYDPMPDLFKCAYADHLKPMTLLAMNTGLRRGEIFNLKWKDINFDQNRITVRGKTAKSGITRHIPMNKVVHAVLKSWKDQQEDNSHLVFPSKSNEPFDNIRKSWSKIRDTAKLADFRWHDLRHHFASKLVMAEVDLNTVRELLGHADLKMTLRYAHLAPEHLEDAVAKLI